MRVDKYGTQCYYVTLILADMNTISQEWQACKLGSLISNLEAGTTDKLLYSSVINCS